MREAAAKLQFEEAARLHDAPEAPRPRIRNDTLTPAGEAPDREAVKQVKHEARAEAAERFRKGRR